jgi:hypothetical protein
MIQSCSNNNNLSLQLSDTHDVVLFYRQYDFYLLFKLHDESKPSYEHFIKEIWLLHDKSKGNVFYIRYLLQELGIMVLS